jgi:hypothetical protein
MWHPVISFLLPPQMPLQLEAVSCLLVVCLPAEVDRFHHQNQTIYRPARQNLKTGCSRRACGLFKYGSLCFRANAGVPTIYRMVTEESRWEAVCSRRLGASAPIGGQVLTLKGQTCSLGMAFTSRISNSRHSERYGRIVPKNLAFYSSGFMGLTAGKAAVAMVRTPPDVAPVGCNCRHLLRVAETRRCGCWKKLSQQSRGASYSSKEGLTPPCQHWFTSLISTGTD